MIDKSQIYSRIGMALISAQRIEFLTGELLKHLSEFDSSVYGITTAEFLADSAKAKKERMMLGQIFKLLKLNPKLVIEQELNEYLEKRNILVHHFWKEYLHTHSEEQTKIALNFCNSFGKASGELEKFFKGFIYLLVLRHVKDNTHLPIEIKDWEPDFDYFMEALKRDRLTGNQ